MLFLSTRGKFSRFCCYCSSLRVDGEKIKAIVEWPKPQSVVDVRSFRRLASFYRRFVRNFSSIVSSLTKLTKKDVAFVWGE